MTTSGARRSTRSRRSGDAFFGRFRGELEDDNYDGHGRRIHLFWNEEGELVWYRGKWGLNIELDRVKPEIGATIAIFVGDAWSGKDGISGFYFGVESEPCADPLPVGVPATAPTDDDLPFLR